MSKMILLTKTVGEGGGGVGEGKKESRGEINHKQITYIQINPKDNYVPNNGVHKGK